MKFKLTVLGFVLLVAFSQLSAAPWSPDGKKMAFSFIGNPENIYFANEDGSAPVTLVHRPIRDFRPEWSPSGQKIIFTSTVEGKHVVSVINKDGSDLRQLTKPAQALGGASYHPDGKKLVMFTDEPLDRDLFILELSSGEISALTQTSKFDEMSPRWSKDGKFIVYVGQNRAGKAESDIWRFDLQTQKHTNLTRTKSIGEFHPSVSNDNLKVCFIQVVKGEFQLTLLDLESGALKILLKGEGNALMSPHFSPDSEWVSYTRTDFSEKDNQLPIIAKIHIGNGKVKRLAKGIYRE